ncbi:NUDIX hydrolase [Rubrobacter indicoceani]|uniref:NUDIX hydrolase n=1 Tax=Rubrobacter indicoceani TaxID=2051957 RepID=UPI000E5B886C|nr:NUDIX domain-containing protein [Rubrobacter indicoceani]
MKPSDGFTAETPFRFCPADGNRLGPPRPSGGATCPVCGRSFYRNSAPAVGAALVRDGKALVTVRARNPYRGMVDVPGGFVELGEHPVDALKREVMEELGVEIEVEWPPVMFAPHRYGDNGVHALAIGFRAEIISGDPSPTDDVADILRVTLDEVDSLDFAWDHDREFIRDVLSARSSGS